MLDAAAIGRESVSTISSIQSQMKSSSGLLKLPWIPYNLVDALLDSVTAVLNEDVSGSVSPAAITKLRERDRSLRHQLSRYFHSISALQQAQEAASLARRSINLDL